MGAGLRHAESGTCSIDIDHFDHAAAYLATFGIYLADLLGAEDSVQISSGRAGRGKLIYRLDTPLPSFKLAPYKVPNPDDPTKPKTYHALEFRCAAANGLTVQDVLPPTIHPETGNPYTWVYGDTVLGHWSQLPPLPAALEALWRAQLPEAPTAPPEPVEPVQARADEAELVAFLKSRDPDATYDGEGGWLETGAILHYETRGSARGLLFWDTWSRLGKKYDGKPGYTPAEKWRTFRLDAEYPATIGQFRQEQVSAPEDFAVVPAGTTDEFGGDPDVGEDTRPTAQMQRLLEPRLVYLLNQGKYYFLPQEGKNRIDALDEHGECGLGERQMHMLFNPYMPVMQYEDKQGNIKRKEVKPTDYLEKSRTKQVVGALGFHPGEKRIYSEDHVKYLNRYVPEHVESLRPKTHELEAWQFLIGRIKDDDFRRWLLKFYAFALRNPGVKIEAAPLLYSKTPGNGKTTLMYTVPRLLFGSRYVREVSSDTVNARFTAVLADAWWIVLDELKTDGPKMDRVAVANKIKPWITAEKIGIEKKGLDVYEVRNRVQITASSNFEDPIHIENDDRRWGMSEMGGGTMTRAEKTDLFTGFLDTDRARGVLKWIFEHESLVGFDPKAEPPDTVGKRKVAAANLGTWETKLAEAIAERTAPFDRDIVKLPEVQDFLSGSSVSQLRLGNILRRPPFSAHKQVDATGVFWIWRNVAEWKQKTGSERFSHYETGARPAGRWDLSIPIAIRRAVGDDSEPETETFDDLLGASHG